MLAEYAILPDVFDPTKHASGEACDRHLRALKDCVMSQAIVRNLHAGGWWRYMDENRGRWHMMGKELLKKLMKQGRLSDSSKCSEDLPDAPSAWCAEALASHSQSALDGIVADDATTNSLPAHPLVSSVSNLGESAWWRGGRNSIELKRTMEDYLKALEVTLRHSNSLMFIDPHLDPNPDDRNQKRYHDFPKLIEACGKRDTPIQIEIHRVCYSGSSESRVLRSNGEWQQGFQNALGNAVRKTGAKVEVFIWDDFHDRYLISNLIGILLPNGFDVQTNATITRWARLDRDHQDSVQREFDPAAGKHQLRWRFTISTEADG
jgi:hypothetical protein